MVYTGIVECVAVMRMNSWSVKGRITPGRRSFSKQPTQLWDDSILNLKDDGQLRNKG